MRERERERERERKKMRKHRREIEKIGHKNGSCEDIRFVDF